MSYPPRTSPLDILCRVAAESSTSSPSSSSSPHPPPPLPSSLPSRPLLPPLAPSFPPPLPHSLPQPLQPRLSSSAPARASPMHAHALPLAPLAPPPLPADMLRRGRMVSGMQRNVSSPALDWGYRGKRVTGGGGGSPVSGKRGVGAKRGGGRRESYTRFTAEEEMMLMEGVRRFGAGNWKKILNSYQFHWKRTAVDLKDKYRNVMRAKARKGEGGGGRIETVGTIVKQ